MTIEGHHRKWNASDEAALEQVLRFRDRVGGGEFWLAHDDALYPVMALRISGDLADVHFFPCEDHPGFRALASSPHGRGAEMITLIYEGCDPATGEATPSEFIVPVETAINLAKEFHRTGSQPSGASWFEV